MLGLAQPAFDVTQVGQLALHRRRQLVGARPEQLGGLRQLALDLAEPPQGRRPGGGENAAQVGADGPFRDDLERTDLSQPGHVGPAAKFERLVARLHHPYLVAVLLLEEGDGPGPLGVVLAHGLDADVLVDEDLPVDQILDPASLLGAQAARSG